MNKRTLVAELNNIGFKLTKFEFSAAGYFLEVKIRLDKAIGWEEVEELPISGLEIVRHRQITDYSRQLSVIPSNTVQFKDYVRRYVKEYNIDKSYAMQDLEAVITNYGSIRAIMNFQEYKRKMEK